MSYRWSSFPDATMAAAACAQHLLASLRLALAEGRDATLAVSGGSTPKLAFAELAKSSLDWTRVHLFFVDERLVPPDSDKSNYRLAQQHLIDPAGLSPGNVHRIQGELNPQEAAKRYVEEIQQHFCLGPGELPRFDVIQLGAGPDAHTASLFPNEPLIADRQRIAAAVKAPVEPVDRITLLPGVLLGANSCVFLVAGKDKAPAVRDIFNDSSDSMRLPSQLFYEERRDATWFLDEAAASMLS